MIEPLNTAVLTNQSKMKKILKPFLLLCCVLSFIIYSCTKNNNSGNNTDNHTQSAADNSFAESTNADVANISTQSEDNGVTGTYNDSTYSFLFSPCANVSIDNISSPHQLIIDFGMIIVFALMVKIVAEKY